MGVGEAANHEAADGGHARRREQCVSGLVCDRSKIGDGACGQVMEKPGRGMQRPREWETSCETLSPACGMQ
jgi:hypothetical protein